MLNQTQNHTISFATHNAPFVPFQENLAKTMCVLWLCNCIPSPYNISVGRDGKTPDSHWPQWFPKKIFINVERQLLFIEVGGWVHQPATANNNYGLWMQRYNERRQLIHKPEH